MTYIINLPVFEGPFDLLYHLIQKQEIDIWSVSIADITEQYLDYLRLMEEFNLEIASDFLVMAAALLRLKSKLLLPMQNDVLEEDAGDELLNINSSEELIKRILEYRSFKKPVIFLQKREEEQQRIFFRSTEQPKVLHITRQESFLFEDDLANILLGVMENNLRKEKARKAIPVINMVEEYLIKDKLVHVLTKLKEKKEAVYLDALLETRDISDIIITFVAVLELCRQKKISVWQQRNFGPVLIELFGASGKERAVSNGN